MYLIYQKSLSFELNFSMILQGNIFAFLDYTLETKCELCSPLTSSKCPNVWITLPVDRKIKFILLHKKEFSFQKT